MVLRAFSAYLPHALHERRSTTCAIDSGLLLLTAPVHSCLLPLVMRASLTFLAPSDRRRTCCNSCNVQWLSEAYSSGTQRVFAIWLCELIPPFLLPVTTEGRVATPTDLLVF